MTRTVLITGATSGIGQVGAEAVKRGAPELLSQVTAPGDQYVTFEQIRRHCGDTELVGVEGC